jgi:Domain of unknown function (DUF4338)
VNRTRLVRKIKSSLRTQGFRVTESRVLPPENLDKDTIRSLHSTAVAHRVAESAPALRRYEESLLSFIANGSELDLLAIRPSLVEVKSRSPEERLFRYATLHWTIPISSGYGRRLRFLVMDQRNNKLIGVIGLCDPVIALAGRDQWVGWSEGQRFARLRHVMDAFVLGAVPPYSRLLFGKFVALLCASDEVRKAFHRKYQGTKSRIRSKPFDGRMALVTTMSALGRSSLYNRLGVEGRKLFRSVGFSRGTGEFHFSNGLYSSISDYAKRYCEPSYRQAAWGEGFRNRREVIRKCLKKLKLKVAWSYHGIERECFVIPLATNTREFLLGDQEKLHWQTAPADQIFSWFKARWLLARAERDQSYRSFSRDDYRLWDE